MTTLRQSLRGVLDQTFKRPGSRFLKLGQLRQRAPRLDEGDARADKMKSMGQASLRGFERDFDKMLASSLASGPHTTSVLRSVFGLMPGLSGR